MVPLLELAMQAGDLGAEIKRQQTKMWGRVATAALIDPCSQAQFEAGGKVVGALAKGCDLFAEIEGDDAQGAGGEAFAGQFEVGAQPMGEARSHFVGALALLAEQIERAAETAAGSELVNAATQDQDAISHLFGERSAEFGDLFIEFAPCLDNEFGGSRRRGGAYVGDKVGDGEIGFVADAADDRNRGIGNRARDRFLVERPKIFERTSAASQNQDVYGLLAIEELQGADDLEGGAIALNAHGIQRQVHVVKTASKNAHDVANGGTCRRCDQTDATRQKRERLFSLRGEQTLGFQALFQLIEGQLQRAQADRLDALDVDLIFAAGFVDADGTAHSDVEAIFGAEFHESQLVLEADATDLGAVVFEGAIHVARRGFVAVGEFAFDKDVGEVADKEVADLAGQLAHGEDAAFGHEVELELAHLGRWEEQTS